MSLSASADEVLQEIDRLENAASDQLAISTAEKLERFRGDIVQLRDSLGVDVVGGSRLGPGALVRWVSDWVPDLNHPLVSAVGRFERELNKLRQ